MSRPRAIQGGITLLEVIIVIGLVALLLVAVATGVRRATGESLREQAVEIAAVLRFAHANAAQTGQHHRVAFDLDEQTFRVEVCEDLVRLRKVESESEEEADPELVARLLERPPTSDQVRELLEAASPEEALEKAAALEGVRIGGARCRISEDWNGDAEGRENERQVRTGDRVKVRAIHAQHLRSPARTGTASLSFFPLGSAEKAVIEIEDERSGDVQFVIVHRLSGRVELKSGRFDPDDHMRRDASGQQVERDR